MSLTDLIVVALATQQVVEVWHHSQLFADWRAYVEAREDVLTKLLNCPFCLSLWAAATVAALWLAPYGDTGFGLVADWLVGLLAASRLANLFNDLFRGYCRTPGHPRETAPALPE